MYDTRSLRRVRALVRLRTRVRERVRTSSRSAWELVPFEDELDGIDRPLVDVAVGAAREDFGVRLLVGRERFPAGDAFASAGCDAIFCANVEHLTARAAATRARRADDHCCMVSIGLLASAVIARVAASTISTCSSLVLVGA